MYSWIRGSNTRTFLSACINACRRISHLHGYLLINNSTLVFEHLSPSSFHSKQQIQHSVVNVASFLLNICGCGRRRSSRGWIRACSLLWRTPPLCLAWLPEPEPELRLRLGFRSLSPTTGSGQNLKEFEDSLMALLSKETESAPMEYSLFRSLLCKFNPESDGNNVNNRVLSLFFFCCELTWWKLLKDEDWIIDHEVAMEVWNSSARINP